MELTLAVAFVGGLFSFLSPCVLPLVPPYLCFLTGISAETLASEDRTRHQQIHIISSSIAFVLGFSTVFVGLGATASTLGILLSNYFGILSIVAGIIIIGIGLQFLGLFQLRLLNNEVRFTPIRRPMSAPAAYVTGLAFAFGWTPCVGPILAAILALAGREADLYLGSVLLFFYSMGIGVPFVLAGMFGGLFIPWLGRFRENLPIVERIMGVLLVITGILFLTGLINDFAYYLFETYPVFQIVG